VLNAIKLTKAFAEKTTYEWVSSLKERRIK